jgi:hypothetical protein
MLLLLLPALQQLETDTFVNLLSKDRVRYWFENGRNNDDESIDSTLRDASRRFDNDDAVAKLSSVVSKYYSLFYTEEQFNAIPEPLYLNFQAVKRKVLHGQTNMNQG